MADGQRLRAGHPYMHLANKVFQAAAAGHPNGEHMKQVLEKKLLFGGYGDTAGSTRDDTDESDARSDPDSDDKHDSPADFHPPGHDQPSFFPTQTDRGHLSTGGCRWPININLKTDFEHSVILPRRTVQQIFSPHG